MGAAFGLVRQLVVSARGVRVMPLSRCNILIVEDQAIIALDLESAVEESNGQVIGPASTVREALKLLHTNRVDAAILDANLPDGDVTPVAEELIAAGIPFLINTGVAVPLQLRRYPGLPVFRKPTPPSRLIRELAALLPICVSREVSLRFHASA
jgi:CheY-like chemotaxis protein